MEDNNPIVVIAFGAVVVKNLPEFVSVEVKNEEFEFSQYHDATKSSCYIETNCSWSGTITVVNWNISGASIKVVSLEKGVPELIGMRLEPLTQRSAVMQVVKYNKKDHEMYFPSAYKQ